MGAVNEVLDNRLSGSYLDCTPPSVMLLSEEGERVSRKLRRLRRLLFFSAAIIANKVASNAFPS